MVVHYFVSLLSVPTDGDDILKYIFGYVLIEFDVNMLELASCFMYL